MLGGESKPPWNLDSELNQSQAALKCKSLANFLNSSIMIFIYSTYFAARIDFTLSKPLFLRQIFIWQGFDLPFPALSATLSFPRLTRVS